MPSDTCSDCNWTTRHLKSLNLVDNWPFFPETIHSFADHLGHSLVELAINAKYDYEEDLEPYALPVLAELTLSTRTCPTEYLKHFQASPLKTLRLVDCPQFSTRALEEMLLAKMFPKLEHLDVGQSAFKSIFEDEDDDDFGPLMAACQKAGLIFKLTPPETTDAMQ